MDDWKENSDKRAEILRQIRIMMFEIKDLSEKIIELCEGSETTSKQITKHELTAKRVLTRVKCSTRMMHK